MCFYVNIVCVPDDYDPTKEPLEKNDNSREEPKKGSFFSSFLECKMSCAFYEALWIFLAYVDIFVSKTHRYLHIRMCGFATCRFSHNHTPAYMHIRAHTHTYKYIRINTHTYTYIHIHRSGRATRKCWIRNWRREYHSKLCVYMHVCMCVHVYMHHVYVYTHI